MSRFWQCAICWAKWRVIVTVPHAHRDGGAMPDERPLHLVANPGDRRSICGIKNPVPVCWAKYGVTHARYRPGCCVTCFERAGLGGTASIDGGGGCS